MNDSPIHISWKPSGLHKPVKSLLAVSELHAYVESRFLQTWDVLKGPLVWYEMKKLLKIESYQSNSTTDAEHKKISAE